MARPAKLWRLRPHDGRAIDRFARSLGVPPLVAQLLLNRGLTDPEDARRFLKAPLSDLHEPELLPGAVEAAQRLHQAIAAGRRICIYGDYDVDGVSGTAILLTLLRELGAQVEFHVPHRLDDGYGLNSQALQKLAADGAALIVTVDCGITSLREAETARQLGLELIITDHHEPRDKLPAADVVVHPRAGAGYPFPGLSGAGVAFKLAWALCKRASGSDRVAPRLREFLLDAIGLATLGTVADVMPLHEENRLFVRHGLRCLRERPKVGIQALLQSAGLDSRPALSASDVGYFLAPRLNAVGRLDSARLAVELLTTTSPEQAADLAQKMELFNQQRQQLERSILLEACRKVEELKLTDHPALVVTGEAWHPGLIGIVAGRLADRYGRPTLMITLRDDGAAVGSGRSIPGFKLHEALKACSEHLLSHGGHATAAGFKLRPTAIPHFAECFCSVAGAHFGDEPPAPRLDIDAEVPLSILTLPTVEALNQLEPYGAGNPQPLLLAGGLEVVGEPRKVGSDKHLSFRVRQNGREFKAIAFHMADRIEELLSAERKCCLVFTPKINEWQGYRNVELEVRDLQPGAEARLG